MQNAVPPFVFRPIPRPQSGAGAAVESLLLVDDGELQSQVATGELAGKSLHELAMTYGTELVGHRYRRGDAFPLLARFQASVRTMPLIVHPDDLTCASAGVAPNSKAWYVTQAEPGSQVFVGIKPRYTQQQFLNALNSRDLEEIVHGFPAEPGDAYYVSAGRVHALGGGVRVLTIEQGAAPALTVSTWGDPELGPAPDLGEQERALGAIHFQDRTIGRIRGESNVAPRNRKLSLIGICPHFSVEELRLASLMHDRTDGSSFHFLVAVDGTVKVTWGGEELLLACGESCLVPASLGYYSMLPMDQLTRVVRSALRT